MHGSPTIVAMLACLAPVSAFPRLSGSLTFRGAPCSLFAMLADLPFCDELNSMALKRMRRRWRTNAVAKLKTLDRWVRKW